MEIKVTKTQLQEVQPFRVLFLHENNFQFVYNKCHDFGWADTYLFTMDEVKIGYGSVWGKDRREDRDAIFEFYLIKPYRKFSNLVFPGFISTSGAPFIECQSNDSLLSSMLYEYGQNINAEATLFEDQFQTNLHVRGVMFRKQKAEDNVSKDQGEYVLEQNGEVVATGGFVRNYNMPYIDMFYEVRQNFRQKGLGSLMVQELKREAYLMGRVPAARCNITNQKSKATLLKGGLKVCGFILIGEIKKMES